MDSGFNHITITIGDDFVVGEAYDVTEQVSNDIFENNKLIYCSVNFPQSIVSAFGYSNVVGIMIRTDKDGCGASILGEIGSGFIAINLVMRRRPDKTVYFRLSYKPI